jgi:hypothetical protein
MPNSFFPPRPALTPAIHAYEDSNPQYAGFLKAGFASGDVQERVAQQYLTARPGKPFPVAQHAGILYNTNHQGD